MEVPLGPDAIVAVIRRHTEEAIFDLANGALEEMNLPAVLTSPQALITMLVRLKVGELMVLNAVTKVMREAVPECAKSLGVTKDLCEIVSISDCVYNKLVDKEIAKDLYPDIRDLDECPVLGDDKDKDSMEGLSEAAAALKELMDRITLPNFPRKE